jgi:serine/threonine-protein kinase
MGNRFLSPDGSSWLTVYASLTATEPIVSHMQSVAFAEGETVTYLRGERDWIAVSGTKGDRIFYRKAVIACGGKVWHHIAFEYPITFKREMDPFVMRAAAIIDQAENDGCEEATTSINPDR